MILKALIIKMTSKVFFAILLLLLVNTSFAQAPNWEVNQNDFQYTMTFVGFLNIDGITLSSTNDKVAAFVNGECRGVTNLVYEASQKNYYAYLTIFSNVNGETIHFKIYNSVKNTVKDIVLTKTFSINQHVGNLFQAQSFALPALSSNAEMSDFSFKDVVRKSILIDGSKVIVTLDKLQSVIALNGVFTLSPGATAYIGTDQQLSGSNSINFTNPVVFKVLSEDQSVLKEWTVSIPPPIIYYRKHVVCYAKGEIKVVYPWDGLLVVLQLNGQTVASQAITNRETIFTNLNPGIYKVAALGVIKEINIIQK
jgi:hypothetical protein